MVTSADSVSYWLRTEFTQQLLTGFFGVAVTVICLVLMVRMAKSALSSV